MLTVATVSGDLCRTDQKVNCNRLLATCRKEESATLFLVPRPQLLQLLFGYWISETRARHHQVSMEKASRSTSSFASHLRFIRVLSAPLVNSFAIFHSTKPHSHRRSVYTFSISRSHQVYNHFSVCVSCHNYFHIDLSCENFQCSKNSTLC